MGILQYKFPCEHKLLMKHKVRLDGKYTAIDRIDTMKHIGQYLNMNIYIEHTSTHW